MSSTPRMRSPGFGLSLRLRRRLQPSPTRQLSRRIWSLGSDLEPNLNYIKIPLPDDYTPGTLVDLFLAGANRKDGGSLFRREPDGEWQEAEAGRAHPRRVY